MQKILILVSNPALGGFLKRMEELPKHIQKILAQENITVQEVIQRPHKEKPRLRFYTIKVRDQESKRDLILKVFGRGEPSVVFGFEKEVSFLHLAEEKANSNLKKYLPSFVNSGNGKKPWYLRECLGGSFLGEITYDFGICEEFLTASLCEEFLRFFSALCDFGAKIENTTFFKTLSTHGGEWYQKDLNHYKSYLKTVSGSTLHFVEELFEKQSALLDESAQFLVHGDLYPRNMFWDGRSLGFTDWEILHRGTCLFDPAFIWVLAWRNRGWRADFLASLQSVFNKETKGERFEQLFNCARISILLRLIRHSELMKKHFAEDMEEEAKKNCQESLEAHHKALEILVENA